MSSCPPALTRFDRLTRPGRRCQKPRPTVTATPWDTRSSVMLEVSLGDSEKVSTKYPTSARTCTDEVRPSSRPNVGSTLTPAEPLPP